MGMPDVKPFPVSPSQAITDIIESIAQEEAALAHIINAEGEKIQYMLQDKKVVHCTGELIELDETVNDVLKTVLKTQMLLQFKLESAIELRKLNTL